MKTSKRSNCIFAGCKPIIFLVTGIMFVFAYNQSIAQSRLSFTLRGAANFPTKKLGNANLNSGLGFDGAFAYRFLPHTSIYAGWGWNRFGSENSFAGSNVDFEETGYNFGLKFQHPINDSKLNYFIGGGAIYSHIEAEGDKGSNTVDTKHGWGWQVDGGFAVPLHRQLYLLPFIKYEALSRDFKIGSVTTPVDLHYLSAGAGLSWVF